MTKILRIPPLGVAVLMLLVASPFNGPASGKGGTSQSAQHWYAEIEKRLKHGNAQPSIRAVVKGINLDAGEITISHGPLPQANMPAMTVSFPVRDPSELAAHQIGDEVEIQPGADGCVVKIMHIRSLKRN